MLQAMVAFIKGLLFKAGQLGIFPLEPFKEEYSIIFLFQKYDISGASKVHLDIVSLFMERKILVVFTTKSKGEGLLQDFMKVSEVFVIKINYLRSLYLGILSSFIDKTNPQYLFGMGIPDFYSVAATVKSQRTHIIDINHNIFGLKYCQDSIIKKLYRRIVIDNATRNELIKHYNDIGESTANIRLISNKTNIPDFINRPEKQQLSIIDFKMKFIGKIDDSFKRKNDRYLLFFDEIKSKPVLDQHYLNSDILLLVSSREGFPLVIMEAMAQGVVPVCTPVGGIPFHIKTGINGFLIEGNEEDQIIESAIKIIVSLSKDREMLKIVSENAYNYAKENFNENKFNDSYLTLFKF
jgi:glycosyltransferase involved in cell wall biosynthesis